jgi:hypothetical protein
LVPELPDLKKDSQNCALTNGPLVLRQNYWLNPILSSGLCRRRIRSPYGFAREPWQIDRGPRAL